MKTSRKVTIWDGPNKRRTRARKIRRVVEARKSRFISKNPTALTFAGQRAHFELGLKGRGALRPQDIVTVQSCQKVGAHDGGPILKKLISLRDKHLPGMLIWPHTFQSFSKNAYRDKFFIPPITSTTPGWFRSPVFKQEMYAFMRCAPRPFEVIDADLCGIFSERNAGDIVNLFYSGMAADKGVLFINHVKGRDARKGKLLSFMRTYFKGCPHFDASALYDQDGNSLDLSREDEDSLYWTRYVLAPIYYVCEAFNAGYRLTVERLVEYRDRDPSTRAGVNMLQWYFKFEELPSVASLAEDNMVKFSADIAEDKKNLREQLELLSQEKYAYTALID